MGQRAALLLSELLLLLAASRTLLAVSFPEDSVPLDIVDAHCEYAHKKMTGAEPQVYFGHDISESKHLKGICCTRCCYKAK